MIVEQNAEQYNLTQNEKRPTHNTWRTKFSDCCLSTEMFEYRDTSSLTKHELILVPTSLLIFFFDD